MRFLWPILLVLALLPGWARGDAFHDPVHHVTITVPSSWQFSPPDPITSRLGLPAGAERLGTAHATDAAVNVTVIVWPRPSGTLARALAKAHAAGLLPSRYAVDQTRHSATARFVHAGADDDFRTVCVVGLEDVIVLECRAPARAEPAAGLDFERIGASVRFDSGYTFTPFHIALPLGTILNWTVGIVLIGGLVWMKARDRKKARPRPLLFGGQSPAHEKRRP